MVHQTKHRTWGSRYALSTAALIALGAASLSALPGPAKANPAQFNPCTDPIVLQSGKLPPNCPGGKQPTPCELAQVVPLIPNPIPLGGTAAGVVLKQEEGCGGVPGRDTSPKNQAIQNRLQ
jgi:hypothetical protein